EIVRGGPFRSPGVADELVEQGRARLGRGIGQGVAKYAGGVIFAAFKYLRGMFAETFLRFLDAAEQPLVDPINVFPKGGGELFAGEFKELLQLEADHR